MNPKIFKAYDIRGIYPKEINEDNLPNIVKAIYTFFSRIFNNNSLTIVLGRDMRLSSPSLNQIAKRTLIDIGANVIEIGLASTPTLYYAVYKLDCNAGIQISASHNPKEYNGIKFLYKRNNKLVKVAKNTGMEEVKKIALEEEFIESSNEGNVSVKDISEQEIADAFKVVPPASIKPFKVVVDPANAMGITFISALFSKLPNLKLIKMNFELDGTFPSHEPNPLKFETLRSLQEKVVSEKADFGIATDGDADRVFFIDEKGAVIPATLITSLIAREILRKSKGEKILVDVRYIRNAKKIIEEEGGTMEMNVVGHSLITEHLNRVGGAFAGESSGHYFFRDTGGAESTPRVILYVLKILSEENKTLSQVVASVHSSFESSEFNFKLPSSLKAKDMLEKITLSYPDAHVSWLDGLTIEYDDWRFNIRSSNTEPLIRLNLEAKSRDLMETKLAELKNKILSFEGVTPDS